ncbi:MAG TPA: hypothetical protein VLT33_37400 [Labilithrix sp.]|nr:hypothetical protein [Labilithrix sp.]
MKPTQLFVLALVSCTVAACTVATPDEPSGTEVGALAAAPSCQCGAEVTDQVQGVVTNVGSAFASKTRDEKWNVCNGIFANLEYATGPSWDISAFAFSECTASTREGSCGTGDCAGSVTVGGGCYFAGHVNYALWGAGMHACNAEFPVDPRFTAPAMDTFIAGYRCKYWNCAGIADRVAWSHAGWNLAAGGPFSAPSTDGVFGGQSHAPTGGTCSKKLSSGAALGWHFGGKDAQLTGGSFNGHGGDPFAACPAKETGGANGSGDRPRK